MGRMAHLQPKHHIIRRFKAPIALAVLLTLSACGEKKPLVTQQQISAARDAGQLEQLYQKVNADLATASGSAKQSLTAIATQIARQIAADKQAEIYQTIEDQRLPSGVVSLALLDQLKSQVDSMQARDAQRANETNQRLTNERTATQTELSKQLLKVSQIPVSDVLNRVNAMAIAARMAGEGSPQYQNYQQQKEQAIVDWMGEADRALANREFTLAATFLRKVLGLDPGNQEAQEKLSQSEQQGFEAAFRSALEDSKPDLALSELKRISMSPVFEDVKGSLSKSINLLHDFFINRALQSSSQGALKTAYQNFAKARDIKAIMGEPPQHDAEVDFLNKLLNFAAVKGQQNAFGEQLGYLEAINAFNPEFPKLQPALQKARQAIVEYAATSMLVQDFAQTGTHHSAGKSVSKQVYAWVFESMPGDIALVNAEQMSQADTSAPGRLLMLEGDILQAGVEGESSNSKKSLNAVVKIIKTPNPKYQEWVEDGREGNPPAEFLVEQQQQNVTVTMIHARKVGLLSVSYRLIDQKTGQVLLNESAREQQMFEGEGNEGISVGEFSMPYKRPNIPTDLEIMEQLSNAVALKIGAKLKQTLQAPDNRYESLADSAIKQNKLEAARNYYSYAAAIRSLQQADAKPVVEKLIDAVINR